MWKEKHSKGQFKCTKWKEKKKSKIFKSILFLATSYITEMYGEKLGQRMLPQTQLQWLENNILLYCQGRRQFPLSKWLWKVQTGCLWWSIHAPNITLLWQNQLKTKLKSRCSSSPAYSKHLQENQALKWYCCSKCTRCKMQLV